MKHKLINFILFQSIWFILILAAAHESFYGLVIGLLLRNPQSVVPESVMPKYGFLENRLIEGEYIGELMATHRMVGVPYTDDMIENARADFAAQADPDSDYDGLLERYGDKVQVRNFDRQPGITEADALVAYLQMLGTLVDFSTFTPDASR